jgi:methyl-accepting chemotaxis protein
MKLPAIDRGQLIKFGLLALAPWIWAVLFVPLWVSAIALLLALIVVGFFLQTESTVNVADALAPDTEVPDDKNAIRRASRPLRRLLARWSGMSQTSTVELGETQGALQEVIEESETAVLNISKSFRNITSRSTQQIEYAMGLLQTTRGPGDIGSGDSNEGEMSLPEYIRAYEVLLNLTIDRLNDFATDCLKVIDSADQSSEDPARLIALREKLRQLATENQTDAEQSRSDAVHLSGGMVLKNQQVNDVLKHINTTAQEIRRDVNQLIVAMQFQDITQQKLERLRGPLLSEIIKSLGSISDETRVLSKQLKMGMLPLPSAKNQGPNETDSEHEAAHIEAALETPQPVPLGSKPKRINGPGDENSVELF